ncbi:hypothetical protein [Gryllotalpicola koreensis]
MESDRRAPSWLKATIRGALIAAAVGGGFFVLSQVLAPSAAHADTVSVSAPSGTDDSLLGPVLQGVGSTLGAVTSTADAAVGSVSPVVPAATSTVSAVVSTAVNALPAPVQAPVKQITAPVAATVTQVTAPVTKTTSAVAAAKPVSSVLGAVSGTVDGVVGDVETVPIVGGVVNEIAGQKPISTVTAPAGAGLDDTVSTVSGVVGTTLTQTGDALGSNLSGDGSGGASVPVVSGALPSSADPSSLDEATMPSSASAPAPATAPTTPQATSPFGPLRGAAPDRYSAVASPGELAQASVTPASVSGAVPSGLPAGPLSPLSGLSGSGASASAGGSSGGGGPTQLAGALSAFDFSAVGAGLSSLVDGDALPASPVFEHDSSPD